MGAVASMSSLKSDFQESFDFPGIRPGARAHNRRLGSLHELQSVIM